MEIINQPLFEVNESKRTINSPLELEVRLTNKITAVNFFSKHHYLGRQGFISSYNFGAFFDGLLVGVLSFGPVSAEETIKGLFGTTDQTGVFEIKRLAMAEKCPKNSESRFISQSIKLLRQSEKVKAIITYADDGVGHTGIIYRATNFKYLGLTTPKKDFMVNGKIQQRGKTKGVNGVWVNRTRKHLFLMMFEVVGK